MTRTLEKASKPERAFWAAVVPGHQLLEVRLAGAQGCVSHELPGPGEVVDPENPCGISGALIAAHPKSKLKQILQTLSWPVFMEVEKALPFRMLVLGWVLGWLCFTQTRLVVRASLV